MPIATINPATGETLREYPALSSTEIEARLANAADAFPSWSARPTAERTRVLRRAAELLVRDADTLGRTITTEMGKTLVSAKEEVAKCALGLRYYADHAESFLAPEEVREDGTRAGRVIFRPLGAILAVMPWNFPFWQVVRFAAPALAAGNVALLKHASNVPACALELERIFRDAGAPDGVFQTLLAGSDRVSAMIADARVAAVTLTGSEGAGREVGAAAGRAIKKVVLELGGSDPFVILATADIARAAEAAVVSRTINNGQSCIAAKRFIVVQEVADEFTRRFTEGMRALTVGDPMDPRTRVGPLATSAIRDELHDQVERTRAAGARSVVGGAPMPGRGFYYQPTVLTDVPTNSPAAIEELFGPVAPVFVVRDADAALRLANASRFGLAASVWTTDDGEAERFAQEIESGQLFVNAIVASDPRFPFGGVKHSGYGRELGIYGLREFVNVKTVRGATRTSQKSERTVE